MEVVEMLGRLGQLLNDPSEGRYTAADKLVRLNIAQQEIMSNVPVRELANLAVHNYRMQATGTDEQPLPLDFFKELSPESIRSVRSGRVWRIKSPETPRSFPFAGSRVEPRVDRSEGKFVSSGRLFDEDVYLSYYRKPVTMKVNGIVNGFIESGGKIVAGAAWNGNDVQCELPETVHSLIVNHAHLSFLRSDQEVKEVQVQR